MLGLHKTHVLCVYLFFSSRKKVLKIRKNINQGYVESLNCDSV